jgi:acetolactate synthase-1/2/3 large subunit
MGALGERVSDTAGLRTAIKRAIGSGKCSVIHVDVDPAKQEAIMAL